VVMGIVGFFSSGISEYGNNRRGKKLKIILALLKNIYKHHYSTSIQIVRCKFHSHKTMYISDN